MTLIQNSDGLFEKYDGTCDITIHCKTEEEQKKILNMLERWQWVTCTERVPEEGKEVLACDKYGEMLIGWIREDAEAGFAAESDDTTMYDCVAWMPLPERYPECPAICDFLDEYEFTENCPSYIKGAKDDRKRI